MDYCDYNTIRVPSSRVRRACKHPRAGHSRNSDDTAFSPPAWARRRVSNPVPAASGQSARSSTDASVEEKLPTAGSGYPHTGVVCIAGGTEGGETPRLWRRHLAQEIPVSLTVSAYLCIPRLQMQASKDSVYALTL